MHARISRMEVPPERTDFMTQRFEEVVVPLLRGLDGFEGVMVLADRERGTSLAISFWESEQALRASEAAVSQPRKEAEAAAHAPSASIVENFEVLLKV